MVSLDFWRVWAISKKENTAHEGNRKEKLLFAWLRGMRTKTYTCGEKNKKNKSAWGAWAKENRCVSWEEGEREREWKRWARGFNVAVCRVYVAVPLLSCSLYWWQCSQAVIDGGILLYSGKCNGPRHRSREHSRNPL